MKASDISVIVYLEKKNLNKYLNQKTPFWTMEMSI